MNLFPNLLTSSVVGLYNIHLRKTCLLIFTSNTLIFLLSCCTVDVNFVQKMWLINCTDISTWIFAGCFCIFIDCSLVKVLCSISVILVSSHQPYMLNCLVCGGMPKGQPLVCFDKIYCCTFDSFGAMLFLYLHERCYFLSSLLGSRLVCC